MKQEHILKAELFPHPFNAEVIIFRASKLPPEKTFKIELAKVRAELKKEIDERT